MKSHDTISILSLLLIDNHLLDLQRIPLGQRKTVAIEQ